MKITLTDAAQSLPRLTRVQTMETLRVTRHPLDRLIASGFLPDTRVDRVAALATRSSVASDEPLVVVRTGLPGWDGGRKIGLATGFTDVELLESTRQWWTCDLSEVLDAGHILVSVAGWCVAVLELTGPDGAPRDVITDNGATVRRHAFAATLLARVDNLVTGEVRLLGIPGRRVEPVMAALGNRLPTPQGAPLIIVKPTT